MQESIKIWIIVGIVIVALLLFLYGVFRRFTRCSWLSWQIGILFAASLLIPYLPVTQSSALNIVLPVIILFAAVAVVLMSGGWARYGMIVYAGRPPMFFRVMNRILGGLTAVLNFAAFFIVLGTPVLVALPLFGVSPAPLASLYASGFWTGFASKHALDLIVITVCLLAVRSGYRVGLMRSLWAVLTIALVFGALVLAIFLTVKTPLLSGWANALAGNFPSLGAYAVICGRAIVAGGCFLVFLIVIVLVTALFSLLMKKICESTPLRVVDGVLLALVFAAIFFGFAYVIDFGVYYFAHGNFGSAVTITPSGSGVTDTVIGALGSVAGVMQRIEQLFLSSPLSARLYAFNPLLLIGG